MALPPLDSPQWQSPWRAFAWGLRSITQTILTLVLFATYLGIGALAHDTHFSLVWALCSTLFVWAGPAQIILITTLGSGATIIQSAIAVTVSAIRLFPMVVSVLPLMRTPTTKRRELILRGASHRGDTVGRMPSLPAAGAARAAHRLRQRTWLRSGLGVSDRQHDRLFARRQPDADAGAAILLLTPLSFLFSTARNSREVADVVALALGVLLYPLAAKMNSGLDILVSGLVGGHDCLWRALVAEVRA